MMSKENGRRARLLRLKMKEGKTRVWRLMVIEGTTRLSEKFAQRGNRESSRERASNYCEF
jgi:hypothetical protein